MRDKKPNMSKDSSKAASLFGAATSTSNMFANNLIPSKKEQEKPSGSMFDQPTNQNQKDTSQNPFMNLLKPSGGPTIFDKHSNTTNIFAQKKTEESGTNAEKKPNQPANPFAQGDTKPTLNPFADSSQNSSAQKTDQQTTTKIQTNQSNQPNQSSIFDSGKNDPTKNNFSLLQQNQRESSSEVKDQGKNMSGQPNKPNKGLFSLSGNLPATGGLFSSTNESKSGGLFGTNTNQSIKGGLFGTTDKIEPSKKGLFETKDTLESNTHGDQKLIKSSQELQKQPKTEQKQQFQQKEHELPSIVHEEKSQEQKNSEKQLHTKGINQSQTISREFLDYLKERKKQGEQILLPGYKQLKKQKLHKLKANLERQKQQNEESTQNSLKLQKEKTQKQEKLEKLKNQSKNELSLKQIIKNSDEDNPTKTYPQKDLIQKEIKDLTSVIQNYYFPSLNLHSEVNEPSNPQVELIRLGKKIDEGLMRKDHLIREQKSLVGGNAQNIRKIQSRQMFGDYIQVDSGLSEQQKADLNGMVSNLETELKRLREQNAKKKKKFEVKKTQLREYSPPQKIAEGRSSIFMKSTIFD